MTAAASAGIAWRVHLGTTGATCVRLALQPRSASDPWPLSRALAELRAAGATTADRPHALGAGRGIPLLHRQDLTWCGCALHLESLHTPGRTEVALELPPWDELVERLDREDTVWDLVDTVAAACDARHGAIGDGEPLEDGAPDLRHHVGVLLRAHARPYTLLPKSGLVVLLR